MMKQHHNGLKAIANLSSALNITQKRTEILPIILKKLQTILNAKGTMFQIPDPSQEELVVELGKGIFARAIGRRLSFSEELTSKLITTNKPYIQNDVQNDPLLIRQREILADCNSLAIAPLISAEQLIGLLWVAKKNNITPSDISILTTIANIAANAFHRSTLYKEMERNLNRLSALRSVDMAVLGSLDLTLTLNIVLDYIISQGGVDASSVILLIPHTRMFECAAERGFRTSAPRIPFSLGEEITERVILERREITIENLKDRLKDLGTQKTLIINEDFLAYKAFPLIAKGEVKGILQLFRRIPFSYEIQEYEFLKALASQAAIAIDNIHLFENLQQANTELILAYDTTIEGWSHVLDLRDKETEGHSQRVTEMTLALGRLIGMKQAHLAHVRRGALLHDIGKMGIPDSILLKPSSLTEEEWVIMRKHPLYAFEMLYPIRYLRPALDIPYCHHERWNGSGYPRGLKGEDIPLPARIFAVVDVWDAVTSDRPYRPAWPEDKACEYIRENSGILFDSKVVETLEMWKASFLRV